MALKDLIPDILEHINQYTEFMQFNLRVYEVLEGQIKKEVEDSLRKEILSPTALNRALERIPPINILRRSTEKLSKVYIESPVRLADNKEDQDIMHNIARISKLNHTMGITNKMYNAQNMVAIEPFIQDGKHQFRVLGGHQFLPYSNDPSNPNKMTVGIKFLGVEETEIVPKYDKDGNVTQKKEIREVNIYALYSDDEFMIINSSGVVDADKMLAMGFKTTQNPFGRIPIVYRAKSSLQLIPFPNQEGFDVSVLVPKLLTDLNYAAQFMSHSIIWTKNADLGGNSINPDAIVNLGDTDQDGADPEIGTIEPTVDIPNAIKLIEFELQQYFDSIGINTKTNGSLSNGRDASGVAKAMDEGDTTASRKMQIDVFRDMETELWELVSIMQEHISSPKLKERRTFSNTFADSFRIKYAEVRPFKSDKQLLEEIQLWRDQKLMTRKQALRQLRPDFTDTQIDDWIKELDKEQEDDIENMLQGLPTTGPERKNDGTFNEGNVAAEDQTPTVDPGDKT